MGIDSKNIPEEYLCELCQPRIIDRERARSLQMTKRSEQRKTLNLPSKTKNTLDGGNVIYVISFIFRKLIIKNTQIYIRVFCFFSST